MSNDISHRLQQTVAVLRKLTVDLGIPYDSEEVQELKGRLDLFVRTGEPWDGSISFLQWNRIADVRLTRKGNVEVTLRFVRTPKTRMIETKEIV
jgi:hypothetical protein